MDEDSAPIRIDHEEGTLEAYQSKLITISYIPVTKEKLKGFMTTYSAKNDIIKMRLLLIIESTQFIQIPLNGIAFPVMHNLTPCTTFNFGECAVHDRRDLYLEFKNENKKMSLQYNFKKIACFDADPNQGTLLPLQSVSILLSFKPKQLGKWKDIIMRLIFNKNKTHSSIYSLMVHPMNIYLYPADMGITVTKAELQQVQNRTIPISRIRSKPSNTKSFRYGINRRR